MALIADHNGPCKQIGCDCRVYKGFIGAFSECKCGHLIQMHLINHEQIFIKYDDEKRNYEQNLCYNKNAPITKGSSSSDSISPDQIPKAQNFKQHLKMFGSNKAESQIKALPEWEVCGDKCYNPYCKCDGFVVNPSKWSSKEICKRCLHHKNQHSPIKPDAKFGVKNIRIKPETELLPKHKAADGKCEYFNCKCALYVPSSSKWSKDKCKSCNHHKSKHKQKSLTQNDL